MRVWRIARQPFQALDGEGARLHGGRWNSEGSAVVYTAGTPSLAVLELLVHTNPPDIPADLLLTELTVPDDDSAGAVVDPDHFERTDWREYPAPEWLAEIGDEWVRDGTFLWLAVPSAVLPQERNILINPRHLRMREVTVVTAQPFSFDDRLL